MNKQNFSIETKSINLIIRRKDVDMCYEKERVPRCEDIWQAGGSRPVYLWPRRQWLARAAAGLYELLPLRRSKCALFPIERYSVQHLLVIMCHLPSRRLAPRFIVSVALHSKSYAFSWKRRNLGNKRCWGSYILTTLIGSFLREQSTSCRCPFYNSLFICTFSYSSKRQSCNRIRFAVLNSNRIYPFFSKAMFLFAHCGHM